MQLKPVKDKRKIQEIADRQLAVACLLLTFWILIAGLAILSY